MYRVFAVCESHIMRSPYVWAWHQAEFIHHFSASTPRGGSLITRPDKGRRGKLRGWDCLPVKTITTGKSTWANLEVPSGGKSAPATSHKLKGRCGSRIQLHGALPRIWKIHHSALSVGLFVQMSCRDPDVGVEGDFPPSPNSRCRDFWCGRPANSRN